MRSRLLLLLSLGLAACGGSTTTPTSPPPPPGAPAAVAVSAGDGQEAAPGTAVSTSPSVLVSDASGRPVPNVSVVFSVDSGGGSVASPSATTNSAGLASSGAWTLGSAEGPQVLGAVAGSLSKVKIRAMARIPTTTITSQVIPTSGGVITVSQPGSPLNGLKLTFPVGSVPAASSITLSLASTAGISLPAGVTPASPSLLLASSGGRLTRPAVVRFPQAPVAGKEFMIAAYSRATGRISVLTPLASDATSITALLPRLDGSMLFGAAIGTSPMFANLFAPDGDPVELLSVQVDPAVLTRDYDSGFRANKDNWDFDNVAIAWLPFLSGVTGGNPAAEVIDPGTGMVATSLWYFENRKSDGPLYNRFRKQADQRLSNVAGLRWAALATREVQNYVAAATADVDEFFNDDNAAVFQNSQFKALKAMMFLSFDRPVPVLLYDFALGGVGDTTEIDAVGIGIATRTVGNVVEIVVPDNELTQYSATVTPEGLTPFLVFNRRGTSYTVRAFSPLMLRPVIDVPNVAAQWSRVLAGTVGNAEGWPTPELHWKSAQLDTASVILGDQLQMWWECPACTDFGNTFPGLPPTASRPQAFQMGRITGGTTTLAPPDGLAFASIKWSSDSVASATLPTVTGHVVYLPQPQIEGETGFAAGWLDWQTVKYRKMALTPTPASLTIGKDTTATWTLAPSIAPPAGTTWSWVLVTAAGRDSMTTTSLAHTRDLKGGTDAKLVILAHEVDTKRVIARDTVTITAASAEPFWRFTTFVDEDDWLDNEDPSEDVFTDMITRLVADPQSGLVAIEEEAGGKTVVRMRVLPSTTWGSANCCPPPLAAFPGEFRQSLGEQPSVTYPIGPFFAGYGVTEWSQSTTDLGAGTLASQFIQGELEVRQIKDQGSQVAPNAVIRISATRNGTSMIGTITVYGWLQDVETGEIEDAEPSSWVFRFTAVRLR